MKLYLDYYSRKIIDNDYFHMDINWFSSWLFLIPSLIEFSYGYFPRVFYFILIPSLINHAHIKKYDHIINPVEKIFIFSTGFYSLVERTMCIISNGIHVYDIFMYSGTYLIIYIYFIAKLSNGDQYSSLYHLIVHILGMLISVCAYMI